VDGVRLDSINRLGKDPAYRDNVAGQPLRQQDWPTLHDHLREVRALVDTYPDTVTVGEVWEFDQRRLLPYLSPGELHLAHNFVFARVPFDATPSGGRSKNSPSWPARTPGPHGSSTTTTNHGS
jgi:alpha-glucosidase